ncbi:hypothetical protein B0H19DRAFT_1071164 [Mycena capillaripes]|nr:hypothetical protein B0H19DRAFT_1071164 [Mycena capillaripes]
MHYQCVVCGGAESCRNLLPETCCERAILYDNVRVFSFEGPGYWLDEARRWRRKTGRICSRVGLEAMVGMEISDGISPEYRLGVGRNPDNARSHAEWRAEGGAARWRRARKHWQAAAEPRLKPARAGAESRIAALSTAGSARLNIGSAPSASRAEPSRAAATLVFRPKVQVTGDGDP